ncbi:crotonase/enoyl-CoA hydratase family protein (plasmid) [Peteryoungia desertarenae]|uniref:Crotonase/enoyl-CoA hydratase family protein n=1 Tax=Peteryoungia desertarenae TaxID=1813451 RepID=A0ABX6QUJ9_9HYPH|nr:crotonase/enoyl-CoA hydratase family protein [Peteryoungia desertarenae]QLF71920.1 crotonase/enoyl-CoA hydratase family protein [Peteryoungia desertarenae]
MNETIKVDVDPRGIVQLRLGRPEKRNALSSRMMEELTQFAELAEDRRDWRAVILSGEGAAFCAGGDLDWMRQQMAADRQTRISEARKLAGMLSALNALPQPLIGAMHGSAFGGGVGMACVCDLVLSTPQTVFGLTETRLGLIPATIGPYVLARMGEGRARRVFMSAKRFGAAEALELGIVSRIVDDEHLMQEAMNEAERYLETAPGAVASAKKLARSLARVLDEERIEESINALADTWEKPEAAEGIAAFFDKRKPVWDRSQKTG